MTNQKAVLRRVQSGAYHESVESMAKVYKLLIESDIIADLDFTLINLRSEG
jgi:hypothetical protein